MKDTDPGHVGHGGIQIIFWIFNLINAKTHLN